MPNKDGTGPRRDGPYGQGRGNCARNNTPRFSPQLTEGKGRYNRNAWGMHSNQQLKFNIDDFYELLIDMKKQLDQITNQH